MSAYMYPCHYALYYAYLIFNNLIHNNIYNKDNI